MLELLLELLLELVLVWFARWFEAGLGVVLSIKMLLVSKWGLVDACLNAAGDKGCTISPMRFLFLLRLFGVSEG